MDGYCGSPFWNWTLSWETSNPELTSCFQRTVLVWTPCLFLWLLAIYEFKVTRRNSHPKGSIHWTFLNGSKCGLITTLIVLQLFELTYDFFYEWKGQDTPVIEMYTPIMKILTFSMALFLTVLNKIHGRRTSAVLFLFWLLLVFCEIPAFRTAIINPRGHPTFQHRLPYVLEFIYFPILVLLFILNCWADAGPHYDQNTELPQHPCPDKSASFLSRLLFFWVEGLARKGYQKPLEFSDLWDLNPENTSRVLNPSFIRYWSETPQLPINVKPASDSKATFQKSNGEVDIKFKPEVPKAGKPVKERGMFSILWTSFRGTFFFASFLKLLQDLLTFASPLILKLILDQVHNKDQEGFQQWRSYFYVFLLLVCSCAGSLIGNQYFYRTFLMGLQIRTAVSGCLYSKALRISNASREETTIGGIVNLMSVDLQKLMDICPYLTTIWSTPLVIGLSLYFLYGLLGPSVFAGLAVMILLIPFNAIIGIRVRRYQTRQMKFKDKRIKVLNEILSGIKVLKLYAWEPPFEDQVAQIRESEMKVLKESIVNTAFAMFLWTCAPVVVAIVTFTTFVMISDENVLDAQKAFVSLSLFNIIRLPLNLLPMMLVSLANAAVGFKRINKYMNSPEVNQSSISHNPNEPDPIAIENANFRWNEESPTLKNINLRIEEGSLVAVVGAVGSGKSTLLSAILGELDTTSGRVNVRGTVAYVSQQPWIQNATVQKNILFERPLDTSRYEKVLQACALKPDLEILPAGDRTEIGEKGINLSGGQKTRVALARATYNNADLYLLDDVLSAVDSNVAKDLFENVLGPNGILSSKTRVFVTHGITYLPQMTKIIVMKDGEITEVGTYTELLEQKGAFADFLIQHINANDLGNEDSGDTIILKDLEKVIGSKEEIMLRRSCSVQSATPAVGEGAGDAEQESATLLKQSPRKESTSAKQPEKTDTLIVDEEMETGNIKLNVVMYYVQVIGWPALFAFIFQLTFQGFAVGSNVWLSIWSSDLKTNTSTNGSNIEAYSRNTYLTIYSLLGVAQGLAIFFATLVMAISTLKASSFLHWQMLRRILRAPLWFFDTTPLGRIVNRFSKDVDVTDNAVPMSLSSWLKSALSVIAAFCIITYTTPGFIIAIIPTAILYFLAQRFYVSSSRQLRRLESVSRSPIFSHFTETLSGATTIRAFAMTETFIARSESIVDHNQKCNFASIVATRFLSVFLEMTGNFVVFFAFLFAVLYSDNLTTGLVGLALSYALQITHGLNWLVDTTSNVENNLVAVERLKEYGEISQEADWEIQDKKPPSSWPDSGQVTYDNYQTRYREGLDLILHGVTCRIEPGEKIGICGRTGAGKSSMALGLFRIIESAGGSISIDGRDTSQMGLHDLRRKLTVIPQDPVIFSGTVRSNLDPFNERTDDELWHSLELAHLKPFIQTLTAGLEYELTEGGENLSMGQKQLLCLARALLRKDKKIIFFDEATSNIDLETDALIQEAIRKEFNDCTILTIAHRIKTILDYTRILVLDKGQVREFDTPTNLLQDKDSLFYGMAKDAGLV